MNVNGFGTILNTSAINVSVGATLNIDNSVNNLVNRVSGTAGSTLENVGLTLTYYSGTYTLSTLPSSGGTSTAPSTAAGRWSPG